MKLPKGFTIHGKYMKIINDDLIEDGSKYGYYNDGLEEIHVANYIIINDEKIKLSDSQILDTLFHELIHCFQFHFKGISEEHEACCYAGGLCEFFKSSNIKINI